MYPGHCTDRHRLSGLRPHRRVAPATSHVVPCSVRITFSPLFLTTCALFAEINARAYKNIAQTIVQGLLLNEEPYRIPEFLFPALTAELTRSDSLAWSTMDASTESVRLEERVLEGSAVPLLRATSVISASSEQPLRLMLASILSSLSIRCVACPYLRCKRASQ